MSDTIDTKQRQVKNKSYKCQVCEKELTRKYHLVRHMLRHTGDKLYKCNVCFKTFTASSSLKNHLMIHTGDQPYSCKVCDKRFITNSTCEVIQKIVFKDIGLC